MKPTAASYSFFETFGGSDFGTTVIEAIDYDPTTDFLYGCGYSQSRNFLGMAGGTTSPFMVKISWDLTDIQWVKWYSTTEFSP